MDLAYHAGVVPATVTAAMKGRPVSTGTIRRFAEALGKEPVVSGVDALLA